MEKKKCFKCGKIKTLDLFYKHPEMADGHLNKCKECAKKDSLKTRSDNIDYYREYDRKRGQLFHRKKTLKNRPVDKVKKKETMSRYRKKYPNKMHAKNVLSYQLRKGNIKRQPCEICGDTKVHAHHDDYNFPLNIGWLCSKHHGELHRELNEQNRRKK